MPGGRGPSPAGIPDLGRHPGPWAHSHRHHRQPCHEAISATGVAGCRVGHLRGNDEIDVLLQTEPVGFDAVLMPAEEGVVWTIRYPRYDLVTPSPILVAAVRLRGAARRLVKALWSCKSARVYGIAYRVRQPSITSLHPCPISVEFNTLTRRPGGEIGRRKGLKIPRWRHRTGSIPVPGTIKVPVTVQ